MKNSSRLRLLAIMAAVAFTMTAAAIFLPKEAIATQQEAPAMSKYIVREHNGMVAVFSGESQKMLTLTDYPVSVLPQADRLSLAEGIAVNSDERLAMLLEDYQS